MAVDALFTSHDKRTLWCGIFFSSGEKPFLRLLVRRNMFWDVLWNCLSFIKDIAHLWAITRKRVKLLPVCSVDAEAACLNAPQLSQVSLRKEQTCLKHRWGKLELGLTLYKTRLPSEPNGCLSLPCTETYEPTIHPGNEGEHSEGMKSEQLIEPWWLLPAVPLGCVLLPRP